MAFKMTGMNFGKGTGSAFLKAKSSFKKASYEEAIKNDPNLDKWIKELKALEAQGIGAGDTQQYDMLQDRINKAFEVSKRHEQTDPVNISPVELEKIPTGEGSEGITELKMPEKKEDPKHTKIDAKTKMKNAKRLADDARKKYGKGSKEHLAAISEFETARDQFRQTQTGRQKIKSKLENVKTKVQSGIEDVKSGIEDIKTKYTKTDEEKLLKLKRKNPELYAKLEAAGQLMTYL